MGQLSERDGEGNLNLAAGDLGASSVGTSEIADASIAFADLASELALDEDNMASDSATALATQQSIKAYVDTQVAAVSVTLDDAYDAGQSITILDTENTTLTFTQNDTTNNPALLTLVNAGTGLDIAMSNTNSGSTGAQFEMYHNKTGSVADNAHVISLQGKDDAGNKTEYAKINTQLLTVTDGSEESYLYFSTQGGAGSIAANLGLYWSGGQPIAAFGDGTASAIIQSGGNQDLEIQTGNATTGKITIANGAAGNISLTPDTTGAIVIGDGGNTAVITSNGSTDLALSPGAGGSASVFISSALSYVDITGAMLTSEVTTSSGSGAVAITGTVHEITTTGTGDALTLANGTNGQRLTVVYVAETAGADTAVLTPTTLAGGSTITFNELGDAAELIYLTNGGWYFLGGAAVVA